MVWVVVWNRVEANHDEGRAGCGRIGRRVVRYLLGSSEIRLILFVAFALFFLSHGTSNWMPTILEEFSGMSPSTAGAWLAVGGPVSIVAGATIPAFATPERMHLLMAGSSCGRPRDGGTVARPDPHWAIAVIGGARCLGTTCDRHPPRRRQGQRDEHGHCERTLVLHRRDRRGERAARHRRPGGYRRRLRGSTPPIAAIASLGGLVALRSHRHRIST